MKLLPRVHLIGSGAVGLSDPGDCHVYLLDGGHELALIDAGCGQNPERLLENVVQEGFDPAAIRYILLTHAHRDHAGGTAALARLLEVAAGHPPSVAASEAEALLLAEGSSQALGLDLLGLAQQPREVVFPPYRPDLILADGQHVDVGDLRLTAILVPGHNPGCLCYLVTIGGQRVLFSGDVVYHGGVISLGNWPGCDLQAYRQGLAKLGGLGVDALLPGHLLWTVRGGQAHIDRALRAFAGLWPPPNIHLVP